MFPLKTVDRHHCTCRSSGRILIDEISYFQNLFIFDVSFNSLKKLPKLPRSIFIIYLSNCSIDEFGTGTFVSETDCPFLLRQLDFSWNEIEPIMIIPNIQILNLSQN